MRKFLEILMHIIYKKGQNLKSLPHIIITYALLLVFTTNTQHIVAFLSWYGFIFYVLFFGVLFSTSMNAMCEIDNRFFGVDKKEDEDII
jgi:hypothetical protein